VTRCGGIMPGKRRRLSTPVDPGSPPSKALKLFIPAAGFLVEAAGTAPASAMPISRTVYCHSQQADRAYIGVFWGNLKTEVNKLHFFPVLSDFCG